MYFWAEEGCGGCRPAAVNPKLSAILKCVKRTQRKRKGRQHSKCGFVVSFDSTEDPSNAHPASRGSLEASYTFTSVHLPSVSRCQHFPSGGRLDGSRQTRPVTQLHFTAGTGGFVARGEHLRRKLLFHLKLPRGDGNKPIEREQLTKPGSLASCEPIVRTQGA